MLRYSSFHLECAVQAPGDGDEGLGAVTSHPEQAVEGLRETEEEHEVQQQEVKHILQHPLDDDNEVAERWQELDEEEDGPDVKNVCCDIRFSRNAKILRSCERRREVNCHSNREKKVTVAIEHSLDDEVL